MNRNEETEEISKRLAKRNRSAGALLQLLISNVMKGKTKKIVYQTDRSAVRIRTIEMNVKL